MSQVFVANSTYQHFHFNYSIPEVMGFRTLEIRAGRQRKFPEDFNETQLQAVLTQLERYGAVAVSDIRYITLPRSLVYSVDRELSSDKINEARKKDEAARQEISAQKTEEAGLVLPAIAQAQSGNIEVRATSLEVTQLEDRDSVDAVKGGVDVEVRVDKSAGKRRASKRRGD